MNEKKLIKWFLYVSVCFVSLLTASEPMESFVQESAFIDSKRSEYRAVNSASNNITPYACHWIDSFPINVIKLQDGSDLKIKNVIELEDGSQWTCNKELAFKIGSWRIGDVVLLSTKVNWIWRSDYSYVLTNTSLEDNSWMNDSTSVEVNPHLGPLAYGSYSTWIRGIDFKNHQVYLINGQHEATTWVIAEEDYELFDQWKVDDHVIIANDSRSWWFSTFNYVILNVNKSRHVRARQI